MVRPEELMQRLMTCPMEIYTVAFTQRADGVPARSRSLRTATICKYQVVSAQSAFFADKAGNRRTLRIYYPLSVSLSAGDAVRVGDDEAYYEVLGVMTNERSLNGLAEVALYE